MYISLNKILCHIENFDIYFMKISKPTSVLIYEVVLRYEVTLSKPGPSEGGAVMESWLMAERRPLRASLRASRLFAFTVVDRTAVATSCKRCTVDAKHIKIVGLEVS